MPSFAQNYNRCLHVIMMYFVLKRIVNLFVDSADGQGHQSSGIGFPAAFPDSAELHKSCRLPQQQLMGRNQGEFAGIQIFGSTLAFGLLSFETHKDGICPTNMWTEELAQAKILLLLPNLIYLTRTCMPNIMVSILVIFWFNTYWVLFDKLE